MENLSTKERILKSAQALFTITGFTGTSTVDIAKNAQVSQGLMFHYFGSKENLWKEAQQNALKDLNNSHIVLDTTLPFNEFLETFLASIVECYKHHSDLFRLNVWDYLEKQAEIDKFMIFPVDAELKNAFRHYQNLGDIAPQLKIEYIETFLLSILHPFSLRNLAVEKQQEINTYIKFCSERLQKSLLN